MDDPERAWPLVQEAILAFGAKVPDLAKARRALVDVLNEEAWRSYDPPIGERCSYGEFATWVEAHPPRGLGTTVGNLEDIAAGDLGLGDALDKALKRPSGRPTETNDIIKGSAAPDGTARNQALRRLRKDRPDLHERVLAGELSPHRAMVDAGFRRRTVSVPVDDAEATAGTLRRQMSPEELARLRELL